MHHRSPLLTSAADFHAEAHAGDAEVVCATLRRDLALRECAMWAGLIFLFCVMDAVCTVIHVRGGATELNPIMACLLAVGPQFFLTTKTLTSAVALGVLCMLLPRIRRGRQCFFLLGLPYFGVCCYHVTGFVW